MAQGNQLTVCISPSKQRANCRPVLQSPTVAVTHQTGSEDVAACLAPGTTAAVRRGRQARCWAPPWSCEPRTESQRGQGWYDTYCKHWSSERSTLRSAHTCKTAIAPPGPGWSRQGRCSSRQGPAPRASSRHWTFGSLHSRAHRHSWHSLFYPTKQFQNTTQHHKPGTITL